MDEATVPEASAKSRHYKPMTDLTAMDKASVILEQLDQASRQRVLTYLADRFQPAPSLTYSGAVS